MSTMIKKKNPVSVQSTCLLHNGINHPIFVFYGEIGGD
jgi:hypothetical protein